MARSSICKLLLIISVFTILLSCETQDPDREYSSISGIYTCNEASAFSGYRKYIVEIDQVRNTNETFIISNFHNSGTSAFLYAELTNDSLIIRDQVIETNRFDGIGVISTDLKTIEIEYIVDNGVTELDYSARYER